MFRKPPAHLPAVCQALFVTFLWSLSWVLIKFGLRDVPALTFAGLRYTLAFLCLVPLYLKFGGLAALKRLSRRDWWGLAALGLIYYAVTQGAQFLGLAYLPAVTVSLLLNLTAPLVALLGIFLLAEKPSGGQWAGMVLCLAGIGIYFNGALPGGTQLAGLLIMLVGLAANAVSAILGRSLNRRGTFSPLTITTVSMGLGGVVLLISGLSSQPFPVLTPGSWAIVGWLALVNTAFAFTLWNSTLRTLSAMESSLINNTMLVQIALLAWLFLGEEIGGIKILGLVLVGLGVLVVQLRLNLNFLNIRRLESTAKPPEPEKLLKPVGGITEKGEIK
jgi:drug/metabolite transporter (DMT)-like permease